MYRVLVTRTLDVPKNLFHAVASSEDEAKRMAEDKLLEFEGDVAIVSVVQHGMTKVIHRLERIKKQV